MQKLFVHNKIYYAKILSSEIEKNLIIEKEKKDGRGFEYFGKHFGMIYERLVTNTIESGDILFVAYKEEDNKKFLLGFVRYHKIEEDKLGLEAKLSGRDIYLLKTIEVHQNYRNKGIGRALVAISAMFLDGDIVTRAYNEKAINFFSRKLSFVHKFKYAGQKDIYYINMWNARKLFNEIIVKRPFVYKHDVIDMVSTMKKKAPEEIYNEGDIGLLASIGLIHSYMGRGDKAIIYFNTAKSIAQRDNNNRKLCEVEFYMAQMNRFSRKHDEALKHYSEALKYAKKNNMLWEHAACLEGIGWCHAVAGEIEKSMKILDEALELSMSNRWYGLAGNSLINIGNCHTYIADYSRALEYYKKSLVYLEKSNDNFGIARTENNIGDLLRELGNYEEAIQHLETSERLCWELKSYYMLGIVFLNFALCYYEMSIYDKAANYANKAEAGFKESKNNVGLGIVYSLLGSINHKTGKGEVETYIKDSLKLLEKENEPFEYSLALIRAVELNIDRGNKKQAQEYCKKAEEQASKIGSDKILMRCNELKEKL